MEFKAKSTVGSAAGNAGQDECKFAHADRPSYADLLLAYPGDPDDEDLRRDATPPRDFGL